MGKLRNRFLYAGARWRVREKVGSTKIQILAQNLITAQIAGKVSVVRLKRSEKST